MNLDKRWTKRMGRFFRLFFEMAKGVSAILVILMGLGVVSIAAGAHSKSFSIIALGSLAILIILGFAIYIYTLLEEITSLNSRFLEYKATVYPKTPIMKPNKQGDFPFRVILKEVEYGYREDLQTMWMNKHFIIQAMHDGVQNYPDRYLWTGTPGTLILSMRTSGYRIVNEHKEEYWSCFDIEFPSPLKKGQKAEFTINWELFDEKRTAIPFLSTPIDFPTNHLILKVVLPLQYRPVKATGQRFESYIDHIPMEAKELAYNPDTQCLEYKVKSPSLRSKYLIRWWWPTARKS